MKLYIGADHRGFELKEQLKKWIPTINHEVVDCGNEKLDPTDLEDSYFTDENTKGAYIFVHYKGDDGNIYNAIMKTTPGESLTLPKGVFEGFYDTNLREVLHGVYLCNEKGHQQCRSSNGGSSLSAQQ